MAALYSFLIVVLTLMLEEPFKVKERTLSKEKNLS